MPGSNDVEISVEDLTKKFGETTVLDGVNLRILSGELVVLVGRSGSGKTTLLRQMVGLSRPDSGRVAVADHESAGTPLVDLATLDSAGMERLERHWAVVFQQNALHNGTVYDDIALPLRIVQNLDEKTIRDRVDRVLTVVGLDINRDESLNVGQLSGGMAKRVAIAAALALDPVLIFYDEPTTGLDPGLALQIQDLVENVHHREPASGANRTTVIISHDKQLLERLAPRVVMLEAGKIIFDGPYCDFAASDSPIIQPYLKTATFGIPEQTI
jgi:phospholipid/cholesterol/gamma-HCH transport system ATP-binding protein